MIPPLIYRIPCSRAHHHLTAFFFNSVSVAYCYGYRYKEQQPTASAAVFTSAVLATLSSPLPPRQLNDWRPCYRGGAGSEREKRCLPQAEAGTGKKGGSFLVPPPHHHQWSCSSRRGRRRLHVHCTHCTAPARSAHGTVCGVGESHYQQQTYTLFT